MVVAWGEKSGTRGAWVFVLWRLPRDYRVWKSLSDQPLGVPSKNLETLANHLFIFFDSVRMKALVSGIVHLHRWVSTQNTKKKLEKRI